MKIKSIKKIGLRNTYDLQVEKNNNFFLTNKLLSHNSGKSCKITTVVQFYQDHGYKFWHIFGGKRQEGQFLAFPNNDKKLWQLMQQEVGLDFKSQGPKAYKVIFGTPLFKEKLPKRLPHYPPRIKHKVFCFSFDDINEQDVSMVLGPLATRDKMLFSKLKSQMPKNGDGEDLKFLINTKHKKAKKYALWNLFLKPLIDNNFICSNNSSLRLDLEAEGNKIDEAFVLCLQYIPEKFWFFIMGNILRRLFYDLILNNKISKRNLALYLEASYFMKVIDSDKNKETTAPLFRNLVVDIARYARSGLFQALDTQDASECKGMIEGQDSLTLIAEMPSQASREITCGPLKADRRMVQAQIRYISMMPIHQVCVVTRGQKAKILKRIQPPRTRYWKDKYGSFLNLWTKLYDKWISLNEFTDIIQDEYKARREYCQMMTPIEDEDDKKTKKKSKSSKSKSFNRSFPKEFKGEGIMEEELPQKSDEHFELPEDSDEEKIPITIKPSSRWG